MPNLIHDADCRFEIGRAGGGGTFVRVVHEPSGCNRRLAPLGNRTAEDVAAELAAAVEVELLQQGWVREKKKPATQS